MEEIGEGYANEHACQVALTSFEETIVAIDQAAWECSSAADPATAFWHAMDGFASEEEVKDEVKAEPVDLVTTIDDEPELPEGAPSPAPVTPKAAKRYEAADADASAPEDADDAVLMRTLRTAYGMSSSSSSGRWPAHSGA